MKQPIPNFIGVVAEALEWISNSLRNLLDMWLFIPVAIEVNQCQ